jgi:hypothetical protein
MPYFGAFIAHIPPTFMHINPFMRQLTHVTKALFLPSVQFPNVNFCEFSPLLRFTYIRKKACISGLYVFKNGTKMHHI